MVKRLINFINKEFSGLHQAAFLLGIASLASQILGLFRDRLLANTFGAGSTLDIYYAAFRIPDMVYVSIGSFLSVTVLIPILIEKGNLGSKLEMQKFMDSLLSFFLIIMLPVLTIIFVLTPWLSKLLFPGFGPREQIDLVLAIRILLFSPLFLGLSNLFGSVTQVFRRFVLYALSPILYNLGIIFGIVFLYPIFGFSGLVYGIVLGALAHVMVQIPVIISEGLFPSFIFRFFSKDIKTVIERSLPRTLGLGALQLAVTFLISLASYMASGSIAVFNFALNLQSVPIALIGISYSVAAFPLLSKFNAEGKSAEFFEHVFVGIRHIIFWALPSVSLLVVLRAQIVRTILGSGRFDWNNTKLTAACLAIFSIGVVFQSVVLMLDRSYYARHKTKVPVITNLFGSIVIILSAPILLVVASKFPTFSSLFAKLFRVDDVLGNEIILLPLAYTLGSIANFTLEWFYFIRDSGTGVPKELLETLYESMMSSVLASLVSYISLNFLGQFFDLHTFVGIFTQGFVSGLLGILTLILSLGFLENQELHEIWLVLHKKIRAILLTIPNQEQL